MRALLDLVLPVHCAGCGQAATVACPDCLRDLAGPPRLVWPRPCPPQLPPPWAVTAYDGAARAMLLAYKEDGVVGLRRPLGAALAVAVMASLAAVEGPVSVVPVPSSRSSTRERGRDVVADLAVVAAARVRAAGRPVRVLRALRHGRVVADSAGLTAAERAANLAAAFTLRRGVAGRVADRQVVLVDDLVTTGTTLAECADALRSAGVRVLAAATVAATVRRGSR